MSAKQLIGILVEPAFLLAFILVLLAMMVPVLLVSRRRFSYAVLYDGLFEVTPEDGGEDVPGDEEAVGGEMVRVVALELKNSTGLNIERSHYERQLAVSFGAGTEILDAEVIEEVPPGLGVTVRAVPKRAPKRLSLEPVLLNAGNMVLLEAVVAGSEGGGIGVEGRMVGVDRIVEERRDTVVRTVLAVANGIPMLLAVSLGALYALAFEVIELDFLGPSILNPVAGGLAGLVAGDIVLLASAYQRWRRARAVRRQVLARRIAGEAGAA